MGERCPKNRLLEQKKWTPIPRNSRFQAKSPTGVHKYCVQRRFCGHPFREWDLARASGGRRERAELSAAAPLSAEPRNARRWCPRPARPKAPRKTPPHSQPPPSFAFARRRAAPPAAFGRKAPYFRAKEIFNNQLITKFGVSLLDTPNFTIGSVSILSMARHFNPETPTGCESGSGAPR